MKPERMLLGIVMAIVFVQFSLFSFAAGDEPWQFTWDRALPDMQLRGVNIVSNSIESAWQAAAGRHLLRSVLVKADEVTETTFPQFRFITGDCQARDLLDALSAHYNYRWKMEQETGVIWIYPASQDFYDLFSEEITIPTPLNSVPMHSEVLVPYIEKHEMMYISSWLDRWQNMFDYPVNIPAGTYTLERLMSHCLLWKPSITFFINQDILKRTFVTELNCITPSTTIPTEGELLFYDLELKHLSLEPTGQDSLVKMLGSTSPRIRWAGRCYLHMTIWTNNSLYKLISHFEKHVYNEQDVRALFNFMQAWVPTTIQGTTPKKIRDRINELVESEAMQTFSEEIRGQVLALALTQIYEQDKRSALINSTRRRGLTWSMNKSPEVQAFLKLNPDIASLLNQR